jgi:hypothetical protein
LSLKEVLKGLGIEKIFCIDCEQRLFDEKGIAEFKDGYRCLDCAKNYKDRKAKLR